MSNAAALRGVRAMLEFAKMANEGASGVGRTSRVCVTCCTWFPPSGNTHTYTHPLGSPLRTLISRSWLLRSHCLTLSQSAPCFLF
jgi:hypothetical protein